MLKARKVSFWRARYEIVADGRPVATWDPSTWKNGGEFTLGARRYKVHGNTWGSRFTMTAELDATVASAERVGRKDWTIEAGGQVYRFRRASMWSSEQVLLSGDRRVGSVRRTSMWRGDAEADLPGLPLPVQVFALGVIVTMWDNEASAGG